MRTDHSASPSQEQPAKPSNSAKWTSRNGTKALLCLQIMTLKTSQIQREDPQRKKITAKNLLYIGRLNIFTKVIVQVHVNKYQHLALKQSLNKLYCRPTGIHLYIYIHVLLAWRWFDSYVIVTCQYLLPAPCYRDPVNLEQWWSPKWIARLSRWQCQAITTGFQVRTLKSIVKDIWGDLVVDALVNLRIWWCALACNEFRHVGYLKNLELIMSDAWHVSNE